MSLLRLRPTVSLAFALLILACRSSDDDRDTSGGAGGAATSTSASDKTSSNASASTGLPPPTAVCTSFVAGADGGGELASVDLGAGSEDMFVPFASGQTLQMEWGFQGLQHVPFTPRAANITKPTIGFVELITDDGGVAGRAQVLFPACAEGWSEVVGYVMIMAMPVETSGTMRLTVGRCPEDLGCDLTKPNYGFVEVLGAKEVHVDVLAPRGPQPGAGGGGGQFG